jgi:hypothetical protein
MLKEKLEEKKINDAKEAETAAINLAKREAR